MAGASINKMENGWIDKPIKKLRRTPRSIGIDIEPFEKFLKKGQFSIPLGVALEKEYGKRITSKEYFEKAQAKEGIDILSLGLTKHLQRINKQIKKQIEKRIK